MKKAFRIPIKIFAFLAVVGWFILSAYKIYSETVGVQMFINYLLIYFALVILSEFTSGVFHECGHALFGLLSGVRARISFKSLFSLIFPSSVEIIPKTDKNLKHRIIFTALGGLTVNLLFIIVGVLALFVPQIPVWISGFSAYNIMMFILNMFPIEYRTGKTDALVISELIKNEDSAKVMLAVLTVQAQILNGNPIEDVDEKLLFNLPQIQEDDPAFISLTELRAEYFAAKGDTENAQKYQSRFEQLKEDYLN